MPDNIVSIVPAIPKEISKLSVVVNESLQESLSEEYTFTVSGSFSSEAIAACIKQGEKLKDWLNYYLYFKYVYDIHALMDDPIFQHLDKKFFYTTVKNNWDLLIDKSKCCFLDLLLTNNICCPEEDWKSVWFRRLKSNEFVVTVSVYSKLISNTRNYNDFSDAGHTNTLMQEMGSDNRNNFIIAYLSRAISNHEMLMNLLLFNKIKPILDTRAVFYLMGAWEHDSRVMEYIFQYSVKSFLADPSIFITFIEEKATTLLQGAEPIIRKLSHLKQNVWFQNLVTLAYQSQEYRDNKRLQFPIAYNLTNLGLYRNASDIDIDIKALKSLKLDYDACKVSALKLLRAGRRELSLLTYLNLLSCERDIELPLLQEFYKLAITPKFCSLLPGSSSFAFKQHFPRFSDQLKNRIKMTCSHINACECYALLMLVKQEKIRQHLLSLFNSDECGNLLDPLLDKLSIATEYLMNTDLMSTATLDKKTDISSAWRIIIKLYSDLAHSNRAFFSEENFCLALINYANVSKNYQAASQLESKQSVYSCKDPKCSSVNN